MKNRTAAKKKKKAKKPPQFCSLPLRKPKNRVFQLEGTYPESPSPTSELTKGSRMLLRALPTSLESLSQHSTSCLIPIISERPHTPYLSLDTLSICSQYLRIKNFTVTENIGCANEAKLQFCKSNYQLISCTQK